MFQENVLKYVLVFNICGTVMFLCIIKPLTNGSWSIYHVDTEPLHHSLMYSLVSLLSITYPFHAMYSLLVTIMLQENNSPIRGAS